MELADVLQNIFLFNKNLQVVLKLIREISRLDQNRMENVQRLRSKLSTLNEAIKFLDQDIIQKDSLIKWANQYSKDLESSESELIERFGLDLEQELKKIGMTLSGHYPELKAGFFTIETNFTKKQVTLWYGPKQDALTKCKLVPHDVIKCMEKCRHQLGSRVSENDFLEKLYKAYSRTGEGKIFEKSPIIKVLAEIAFLIQKPIFYSEPKRENYTSYSRADFSFDLFRLHQSKYTIS